MIITAIKAQNFKVLKSVDIDIPEGTGVIKIIGDNGAGKSSFLEAIECALSGAKGTPFEAIRHGEEEATITVRLKDDKLGGLIITKVLKKESKPTLIIRGDNNTTYSSPQEMLDNFFGTLSFDPLNFFSLKSEKQYQVLKDMLGLGKIDELDNRNAKDYLARTDLNRDIKTKKALKDAIRLSDDEPKQVDVKKLVDKLQKVNDKNNKIIFDEQAYEQKKIRASSLADRVKDLEKELVDVHFKLANINIEIENYKQEELIDVNTIKKEIKDAQETNDNYRKHQVKDQHIIDINNLEKASEALTEKMNKRNDEKMKLLSKAIMPIENLTLDNGIIRFNGTALSECSTAERIKVSFAIGVASNYKLRTIFIKEGELLDKKNLKLIRDLAKEKDYNIMIELLNNDNLNEKGVMKIVIEDGETI